VARIAGQALGIRKKGPGSMPSLVKPVERQVDAATAGVLADIAGDVGQLHRKSEIGSAGEHRAVADAHDQRHHHADA
jgi:hypothetical protein